MNFSSYWFRSWSWNLYTGSSDKSGPIWIHGRLLMHLWTTHPKTSCRCHQLFWVSFSEKKKQHISLDTQSPNRLQEMTDLWLVMFSGGLVASCGSTAWVSYQAQMSWLPAAAGRAAAHGKPVKSRVCAHLAQSRSSHGLVLQPRYFKLFKCITYMQLLREAHIYIHVTHTILQCICAGVGSAQTCNQLWAGSAVVCPMCVNKINV